MISFRNIDPINIYFKVDEIFFVNNLEKRLTKDVEYNFTKITKSSQRSFRNVTDFCQYLSKFLHIFFDLVCIFNLYIHNYNVF